MPLCATGAKVDSTLMAAMGIDEKIREFCLNHAPQNRLDGVYSQHKYEKHMRRAQKIFRRAAGGNPECGKK